MNASGEQLLIINLGSTSTKMAFYEGENNFHSEEKPFQRSTLYLREQMEEREEQIRDFLERCKAFPNFCRWEAIVSRGGLMKPVPAGVYQINEKMCADLMEGTYGVHASSLGPVLAYKFSQEYGCAALTVDPPSTDEFQELARFSGIPPLERKSAFHALSQKAAARQIASRLGIKYEDGSFIVAHLGGGITVGAHSKGKVIDASHGLSEGPFTPERAGALPTIDLIKYIFSFLEKEFLGGAPCSEQISLKNSFQKRLEKAQVSLQRRLVGAGGLAAYLQSSDVKKIEKNAEEGSPKAALFLRAMAYQIAKEIGAMATVLNGHMDAVVLTGALAKSTMLVQWLEKRVSFLAPFFVVPDNEMQALADGVLRALRGEEEIFQY